MPLGFPYTAYASAGLPVTFYAGRTSTRFDAHHFLLSKLSSLFLTPAGLPLIISTPIELPDVDPKILHTLFQWVYERQPPVYTQAVDLLRLMKLWVAAGKLGIWRTQNTVLRLGMALMQPQHFVCPFETVRWVYENTAPGCALRGYIVALFCQRGPPLSAEIFAKNNEKMGIFRDASNFLRELQIVRSGNPKGVKGYNLMEQFGMVVTGSDGRWRGCLVTEGREVDWERVQYRLPEYLVWGEDWEVLPDRWFVSEEGVRRAGWEVVEQLGFGGKRCGVVIHAKLE